MDISTQTIVIALALFVLFIIYVPKFFNKEGMSVLASDDLYAKPYGRPIQSIKTLMNCPSCNTGTLYNFVHKLPTVRYTDLIKEFGDPNIVVDEPGGLVIWYSPKYFEEIVLRD